MWLPGGSPRCAVRPGRILVQQPLRKQRWSCPGQQGSAWWDPARADDSILQHTPHRQQCAFPKCGCGAVLLSLILKWKNWSRQRLGYVPRITQEACGCVGIRPSAGRTLPSSQPHHHPSWMLLCSYIYLYVGSSWLPLWKAHLVYSPQIACVRVKYSNIILFLAFMEKFLGADSKIPWLLWCCCSVSQIVINGLVTSLSVSR